MDQQSREAISRLCEKVDLSEKAQDLFYSLKAKTSRGSGYELNQKVIALPAISSLLASEQLGYNDVTEKIAQAASCLNSKDFAAALTTVRKALASAEREKNRFKTTYESLVLKYAHANGDFMVKCMKDVEAALVLSADLRGPLRPPNDVVTVAVFVWTCKILGINRQARITQHAVNEDDYQEVVDVLEATCKTVKKDIQKQVKALRAERKAAKAAGGETSPSKPTLRSASSLSPVKSPSKSALRGISLSPTKTPAHKRKVAFSPEKAYEDTSDSGVEDTPSKRQKYSSPRKYASSAAIAAFKDSLKGRSSSSKFTLEHLQDRMSEDEDMPGSVPSGDDVIDGDCAQIPPHSDRSSDTNTDIPHVEMSDASASSEAASITDAGPSTPRRSQRSSRPRFPTDVIAITPSKKQHGETPLQRGKAMTPHRREDDDAEDTTKRRRRPALLEHRQWLQKDSRRESERKIREQWVREMIEKHGGHPFENMKSSVVA
ncbi:hypothetical protein BC835DRAFT_1321240 [Cytidiella melzeri]|nr:hypothetical protein BC835DRAFT_1321240 [Cytidiella melzeri]